MLFPLVVALMGWAAVARTAATVALEEVSKLPRGWSLNSTADGNDSITVFLAVKQPKLVELKTQLVQTGALRHRSTASHYSRQQIRE